jgi:RNA polymerase sigma-70 factor (ECF subfamily)
MINDLKEKLLVALARKNDPEAFAKIYNKYIKDIYRYILFRVPNKEIAQDLAHDTFANLLRFYIKDSSKEIESLRGLIYQIAKNFIADYYRKEKADIFPLTRISEEGKQFEIGIADEMINLDEIVDKNILADRMFDYIADIKNDDYRQIIQLRFVENKEFEEISEIMEKEISTLRVVLHRALQQLKKKILDDK